MQKKETINGEISDYLFKEKGMVALTVSLAVENSGREFFPGKSVVFDIMESYFPFCLYSVYKGGAHLQ